jgi:hypothetical protein
MTTSRCGITLCDRHLRGKKSGSNRRHAKLKQAISLVVRIGSTNIGEASINA